MDGVQRWSGGVGLQLRSETDFQYGNKGFKFFSGHNQYSPPSSPFDLSSSDSGS